MTAPADTGAAPVITGPLCDLCGAEEAIGSIMSLADYATVKFGPACVVGFLRGYADDIDDAMRDAAPSGPVRPAAVPPSDDTAGPQIAPKAATGPQPGAESAGTPDPMTARVVRSTHGHRKAAGDDGTSGTQPAS